MEKIRAILIKPEMTIKQALKYMDEIGKKTLFVSGDKDRLCGAVTDGDIRRWILKGASLNSSVSKVMNKNPIFIKEGFSKEEAGKLMTSNVLECVPVVDSRKRIISAIWWHDLFDGSLVKHKRIGIPVVIMAGGTGARLSPFTNVLPKPLIPVGEKPIIELIIDKFMEYGCRDFYLSINYKANMLKAYFNEYKHEYNINYIQEEEPLGTIGSLSLLKNLVKSTFFVSNCDILIEADYSDIIKFHKKNKNKITVIVSMRHYAIPYGICDIVNGGILKAIREKPEYDFLVNTGMYLMERSVINDIPQGTFYNATDLINDYIQKNNKIGVYPVSEKSWLDMGQWQELQKMLKKLG